MTDSPTTFADLDFTQMLAREEARRRLAAEAQAADKEALCRALEDAGITRITIRFDGGGDSGQVESITALAGERAVALPVVSVSLAAPLPDGSGLGHRFHPLAEAIEDLAYACLDAAAYGWENDDGAYGEIRIDVAARTVTLDLNARVTAVDASEHVF